MNNSEFEERLINIEIAIANQERVIEDLNQVIIYQGNMLDKLFKQNQYLISTIGQDMVKPLSEETPPPHY